MILWGRIPLPHCSTSSKVSTLNIFSSCVRYMLESSEVFYYQFETTTKKEYIIPSIWICKMFVTQTNHYCCFLSIDGKAGRGVWGAAPEVPGERHRPCNLCAEVQEAPHGLPQAGVAPSGRPDITPLTSGQASCQTLLYSCSPVLVLHTLCLALFYECRSL